MYLLPSPGSIGVQSCTNAPSLNVGIVYNTIPHYDNTPIQYIAICTAIKIQFSDETNNIFSNVCSSMDNWFALEPTIYGLEQN